MTATNPNKPQALLFGCSLPTTQNINRLRYWFRSCYSKSAQSEHNATISQSRSYRPLDLNPLSPISCHAPIGIDGATVPTRGRGFHGECGGVRAAGQVAGLLYSRSRITVMTMMGPSSTAIAGACARSFESSNLDKLDDGAGPELASRSYAWLELSRMLCQLGRTGI